MTASNRIIFVFIISLNIAFSALGQSFNFQNFTVSHGLASSRVHSITQDDFGNLWIGTQGGGISKFNGLSFENYTIREGLASNFIRSMVTDQEGNIWAATAEGVTTIQGDTVMNFNIVAQNSLKRSVVTLLNRKDSSIWLAHSNGSLYYIKNQITYLFPYDFNENVQVTDLKEDSNGVLWGVTNTSSVFKIEKEELEFVYQRENSGHFVLSLLINNDEVFLCTNKGVFGLNQGEVLTDGLEGIFVQQAVQDNYGDTWIISTQGLMKITRNGEVNYYNKSRGFSDESVKSIFCDNEGTMWFGTDGGGIFKLSGDTFSRWDTTHGLSGNLITSVTRAVEGSLWLASYGNGLTMVGNDTIRLFNSSNSGISDYIICTTRDKAGNLWFGTRNQGLYKYDGKFTHYEVEDGISNNSIRCLFGDSKGNIWIGTATGLSRFDGKAFNSFAENDKMSKAIWSIGEDEELGVYVVTRDGMYSWKNQQFEEVYLPPEVFEKRLNTIVHHSNSGYWIGFSGYGLLHWDGTNDTLNTITTDDGLSSDIIHSIVIDDLGNLLVGTDRGVDKLFLGNSGEVDLIKSYGNNDGFSGLHTLYNSHFKDDDGSVWFGSSEGAFHYNPAKELINTRPPITYISSLRLNYQETDWNQYSDDIEAWTQVPLDLKLKYNENNLVFEYFGNSLLDPSKVNYQFKLENLEDEWSPVVTNTEVAYSNLSPGKYVFKVRSQNSDGIWSATPATISLEIIPPFWQEWWFYLLIAVVFIITIVIVNDYRINARLQKLLVHEKIREEEQIKVRHRMARDFHDNMGNQLASITVFTNLISIKLKDRTEEIDGLLKSIEHHTQSLFNGTKDFIWSMDPSSDDLGEIFTYLRDFGEDLFERSGIKFYAALDEGRSSDLSIPSGSSRHIVLIFKEAMTNTLKHSQATTSRFEMNITGKKFVITFGDDGVGLSSTQKQGKGLNNMSSRANETGFEVHFSEMEKGLQVMLSGKIGTEPNEIKEPKTKS